MKSPVALPRRIPAVTAGMVLLAAFSVQADTPITLWGDGTVTVNYSGQGAVANLNAGNAGAVGGNNNATASNRREFYQISAYNVAQLLTDLGGISLSQLNGYTFTYSGTTVAGTVSPGWDFADSFIYHAAYIGQWADTGTAGTSAGDVPQSGTWSATPGLTTHAQWTRYQDAAQAIWSSNTVQFVNLNTSDNAAAQSLSASGFNLSGLATALAGDTDLTDNYVFFGFYFLPHYQLNIAANQEISGVTLSAQAVPEPAAVTILGLGALLLLRRRRSR